MLATTSVTVRPDRRSLPERTCPGGERGDAATDRFVSMLRQLAQQDGPPVLVVAQTTVTRLSLRRLLGIPLDDCRTVFAELGDAMVTTLALDGVRAALIGCDCAPGL